MPASTIHGDVNPGNVLVARDDPERVAGIVDFGDLVHARTVIDPAIAAAYQAFGGADPLDPLVEVVTAYHAIRPLSAAELRLVPEIAAARMAQSLLISSWRAELHPDNVDYILADADDCFATLALLDEHDPEALAAALAEACGVRSRQPGGLAESLTLREARLGPALSLSYDEPVHLASGDGVWLTDVDGNRLLDAYNNVPQVGHSHPRVTAALAAQARRLTTNTRYLVDEVAAYADRLAALLPGELSVVMFVNSGSEANDVAIQIARAVTGSRGAVITEHAYHGTTAATAALSPEELGPAALEPWVARIGGAATLGSPDAAARVGGEVDGAFARLREAGHGPACLICDDVFSSDGIFAVPPGYLVDGLRAGAGRRRALHRRRGAGRLRPGRDAVLGVRAGRRHAGHRHPRQADGQRPPDGCGHHNARRDGRAGTHRPALPARRAARARSRRGRPTRLPPPPASRRRSRRNASGRRTPLRSPGVVTTAPIGWPLPIGLPRVTMSGTTPSWAKPQNAVPTRPKPAWTSSARQSAPAARARASGAQVARRHGEDAVAREDAVADQQGRTVALAPQPAKAPSTSPSRAPRRRVRRASRPRRSAPPMARVRRAELLGDNAAVAAVVP